MLARSRLLCLLTVLAASLAGQDSPRTAAEWLQRGVEHYGEQQWATGRAAFERAAAAAADAPADAAWAHCWIASCLDREGHPGSAMDHLETAIAMFEGLAAPPPGRFVQALTLYAQRAMDFGDSAAATAATERALAAIPEDDFGTRMVVTKTLAQCRDRAGDHVGALAALVEADELAERGEVHAWYRGQVRYEHARQLLTLGRLEAARRVMDETLQLLVLDESQLSPERRSVIAGARDLSGALHARLGDVERALADMDAAVAGDEDNPAGDRLEAAMRRMSRGALLRDHALRDLGIADLERARRELAALLPRYDDQRALCDVMLASAMTLRGDGDGARDLFAAALDHGRRENSDSLPYWLASRGRLLLEHDGDPGAALPLLREAVALLEARRGEAARLDVLERSQFSTSLDPFADYSTAFRAAIALGEAREAFHLLELARSRSLLDLLERRGVDPLAAAATTDPAIAALTQQVTDARGRASVATVELRRERGRSTAADGDQAGRLEELARRQEAAERDQRAAEQRFADALRADAQLGAPASTDEVLARLPAGTSLLQYHVTDQGCWLLRLQGETAAITVHELRWPDGTAITPAALRETIHHFVARLIDARSQTRGITPDDEDGDHLALGQRLFRALVPAEVWRRLGPDDSIYLAPHGPLQRLPFEALVVTQEPKPVYWLARGPAIAYVPSASVLLWCLERHAAQQTGPRPPIDVVALGDPAFDLPRLVHSGHEVAAIPPAFGVAEAPAPDAAQITAWSRGETAPPRAVALLREQATVANLERLAPLARIVHVATHQLLGRDDADRPFSHLVLTDSQLSLQDLIERWPHRLDGCELVVLSACDTHRSELAARVQDREGVMALPWGLHFAGCPAVIASLWQVEDAGTAALMQRFYARLAAGEADPLRAFTAARREYLEQGNGPGRWAPFLFLGAHAR